MLFCNRSVEVASMLLTHAQMDRVDHESTTFTAGQLQKVKNVITMTYGFL